MKRKKLISLEAVLMAAAMAASLGVTAAPVMATDSSVSFEDQLNSEYNSPVQQNKTETRWWFPEGALTDEIIEQEIKNLHDQGFTGFELCQLENEGVDSNTYAYGSEEWAHDVSVAIKAAAKYGMYVGLTSGTHWHDANVPGLDPNSNAAMQQAAISVETVKAGQSRTGELKEPDPISGVADMSKVTKKLIGCYAYRLQDGASSDGSAAGQQGATAPTVLDGSSMIDLTSQVKEDNTLDWTAPDDGDYVIYAEFQRGTWQAENPSQEQAYPINYYDEDGVEALKTYLQNYLFSNQELADTVRTYGNVQFFMDSLEINANTGGGMNRSLYWSDHMAEEFQKRKGYDIRPYLPLLMGDSIQSYDVMDSTPVGTYVLSDNSALKDTAAGNADTSDGTTLTAKIKNDVYDVQTQLIVEKMMDPLREWSKKNYNMQLRAQMSYGTLMEDSEMGEGADYIETETLNMKDQTDSYRRWSGVAHIQNALYSSETACVFGMNYALTEPDYIKIANLQYAAGVNRVIWHGHASQWGPTEELASWPGYEGMGMGLSTRLDSREPLSLDYDEMNDYFGRVQSLLREGTSATDLGILHKGYGVGTAWPVDDADGICAHEGIMWKDMGLQDAGYTYDYLSGDFLSDMDFDAATGTLGDTVGYKAILVEQQMIDKDTATRLLELAKQGLKVVFVGDDAATLGWYHAESDEEIQNLVSQIKQQKNVVTVSSEADAKAALEQMNVLPRAELVGTNTQLLTQVRQDGDDRYLYVYNYCNGEKCGIEHGLTADSDISVEGTFIPYEIDPWTGEVQKVADYTHENGRTIIHTTLQYNDVALYAFDSVVDSPSDLHVVSTDADKAEANGDKITINAYDSGKYTTQLSNGETIVSDVTVPETIDLTGNNWDLSVEDWQKGDLQTVSETRSTQVYNPDTKTYEPQDVTTTNYKYDTKKNIISVSLNGLKTWDEISGIGDAVSGVGTYKTSFTWDTNSADGAVLTIGNIVDSAKVYVNGQKADQVDTVTGKVDISNLVKDGQNNLEIRVTSSLLNRLIQMGIQKPAAPVHFNDYKVEIQKIGPTSVTVTPYVTETISQNSDGGKDQGQNQGNNQNQGQNENNDSNSSGETPSVFTDVSDASAFYYDAVYWAVKNGITFGTTDTTFSPDQCCTRGQIVSFLYRQAGSPSVEEIDNPFEDVTDDAYYHDAVVWAAHEGITVGTSATTFSPVAKCTRGQIVTFLYRADDDAKASGTEPFTDVNEKDYYYDSVRWATEKGVTKGTTPTTFSPNATCTRGQAVTFLYRAAQ